MLLILGIVFSSYVLAESNPIKVEVNNQELVFDVEPTIIEGLTLVHIRAIFESLGLEVSWDRTSMIYLGINQLQSPLLWKMTSF